MTQPDQFYMQRCITLAKKGSFSTRPNPAVGAVLVRDGEIVGEGWHEKAGLDHAEIVALKQAGERAKGATLYVTLEPCSFTGKTGPCCDAVIAAGVGRVVFGMVDPNPRVAGSGLDRIREAGIPVDGPVLEKECETLNPGFSKRMREGLPYVRCKLAMSLDGRTAMASGESQWITGEEARQDVQHWRAMSGVVMTGIGTVLSDDPGLNVRLADIHCDQPLRVVVDSTLKTPPEAKTLHLPGEVLLATAVTTTSEIEAKEQALDNPQVTILPCVNTEGQVDLESLLRYLAKELQINEVMLESGPTLAGAMLRAGLIDEVITYIAPKLLGSDARPLFHLPGMTTMADQVQLEMLDVAMVGKDCRMRSRVKYGG